MTDPTKMPMIVYRFFTDYVPDPNKPGQKKPVDKVEYGPIGSAGRTQIIARINELQKIREDAGANPASMLAKARWEFIKPRYDAWKAGQEMPETGTPLAVWNLLTPEQAEVLRASGVKTVEAVASLTDTHIQRIPIPNLREIIAQSKVFLEAQDTNKFSAEMAKKDELIAGLSERVEQLAQLVADGQSAPVKRKPGRPRKDEQVAA